MVTVSKIDQERKVTPVKISDADWKTLIKIFDDITLEELKDLKSPTEKRFMTVQRIANLKITYKDVTYETPSFDHGFPPYEVKKLVTKLTHL
jgi:hypothetical protein